MFLTGLSSVAQSDSLSKRYIRYDIESGLNTDRMESICQDSTGFIYIGTGDGFYQFDGLRFREIINPHNAYNFFHKVRSQMYNVHQDEIILETNYGLYSYNWARDSVELIDSNNIQDVYINDETDQLWYTSLKRGQGYFLKAYDLKTRKISARQFKFDKFIHAICVHPTDPTKIFISQKNDLVLFDTKTERITTISIPKFGLESQFSDFISDIESNGDYVFLALEGGGLMSLDLIHFKPEIFRYDDRIHSDEFNVINQLVWKDENSFYISSSDRGAGEFHIHNRSFSFYGSTKDGSIPVEVAKSIFEDKEGNLWISLQNGLYVLTDEMNHFQYSYFKTPQDVDVNTIHEYDLVLFRDSLLFQGASKAGTFFVYDKEGKFLEDRYSFPKSWTRATSILNYEDEFLMSFDRNYVYAINPMTKKVQAVIVRDEFPEIDGGFSSFEMVGDTLFVKTAFEIAVFSIPNGFQFVSSEKLQGQVNLYGIIAQSDALYLWSKEGLVIREGINRYRNIEAFNSKHLFSVRGPLFPSRRGTNEIVFGSNFQGVIVFNTDTEESYKIDKQSGTNTNKIVELSCDERDNIWGLSSSGLMLYNAFSKQHSMFNKSNGLVNQDLIFKRILALNNGKIVISVDGGLQILDLSNVDLDRAGEKIIVYSINGERSIQDQYPYDIGQIEIAFSNFDYGNTTDVKYDYKLNNEPWRKIKSTGVLALNSLASGNYNLQLRATDMYARLSYSDLISFSIAFPWWRSWWFQILAVLTLLLLGIVIFYFINKPKQQLKKVESEYQGLTKELENQVLRAQMNPHFLFNSLNSIRFFILNKDTKKAANYLTKFSRLIRLILEHSSENVISLASELDMIGLYIDLESIRFEDKFDFVKTVNTYSDLESLSIPPMIIQPFLENAILHGINAKESKARLQLHIVEEDAFLLFEIIDDGIGRKKAAELKRQNSLNRKSLGMNITEKRLRMISERYPSVLKISDLTANSKYPGTKVEIKISKQKK